MPDKHGKGTHLGYMSPPTGGHTKGYANTVRVVYGECRVHNPGEDPNVKAMCARIAHSQARKTHGH